MRKAIDTLIGVAIGFLVTLLLNSTVSYMTQPTAVITTGTMAIGANW